MQVYRQVFSLIFSDKDEYKILVIIKIDFTVKIENIIYQIYLKSSLLELSITVEYIENFNYS
tara:strand:+ start:868 stop:1053 length:186 start_codon:yes stop_codon:yes gene_type:complete